MLLLREPKFCYADPPLLVIYNDDFNGVFDWVLLSHPKEIVAGNCTNRIVEDIGARCSGLTGHVWNVNYVVYLSSFI